MDGASKKPGALRALPRGIWALGLVSGFMDMSSELIHSLLPLFLVGTLGASAASLGLIEGIAEATASVTKVFSGALSDWLGKRKLLAIAGYGLAALTKPFFPLAHTIEAVFFARFADRLGKGIRGAPRDALVADITPLHLRGAAYGLRQSLDTVGAIIGPLLAMAAMALLSGDLRGALWVAVLPAFMAVALLAFGVKEPQAPVGGGEARTRLRLDDIGQLSGGFWLVVGIGALMTLARFSEAFLILRGADAGLGMQYAPLVMVVMSAVYTLCAYPAGALSDEWGRRPLLLLGMAALVASDVALALAREPILLFAGVAFWGLHMGLTQGLFAALVADTAPLRLRGTAFGLYNLINGGALLAASVIAGALWDRIGASATFWAGAGFTAASALGLLLFYRDPNPRPQRRTTE
ncbi:MAG TPA: MFS transporter [Ferrovibrio sp.]|uniref:MFS transporter n=1 Tax=Ferrovibrio sp. TaxID=1917215 RepID=UPI002ED58FDD